MKIEFPRNFLSHNSILPVLNQTGTMFRSKGKEVSNFRYDCTKIHRISMLGVLMMYKIVDYAYKNKCFFLPIIYGNSLFLESVFKHYGFLELFNSYINNKHNDSSYEYLKFKTEGNLIIAPQPLLRGDYKHVNDILQNKFAPKLNSFYESNPKAIEMIFGCICEIIANYWEHAIEDSNSLLVAEGYRDRIEISCADTGNGIISTLKKSAQFGEKTSDVKLLRKALSKGVTSKPKTNHMGYGLWLIDQIVTRTGGIMHIYSEGVYYQNERGRNKFGEGGEWKGSIIYLQLPLNKPVTPSQVIEDEVLANTSDLLINFG